jgi:hypothetical protein
MDYSLMTRAGIRITTIYRNGPGIRLTSAEAIKPCNDRGGLYLVSGKYCCQQCGHIRDYQTQVKASFVLDIG